MESATKSRTSEDILRSSSLSTYSPEPYTQSESDYYPYTSSPRGNELSSCFVFVLYFIIFFTRSLCCCCFLYSELHFHIGEISFMSFLSLSLPGATATLLDRRRWRELESGSSKSESSTVFSLPFFRKWLKWQFSAKKQKKKKHFFLWRQKSLLVFMELKVFLVFSFSPAPVFPSSALFPLKIGSGIGRMILKEEMKARSGSYDNDPWGSARNSRCGSKETLNTTGYGTTAYNNTVNGCEDNPALLPLHSGSPSTFCLKVYDLWARFCTASPRPMHKNSWTTAFYELQNKSVFSGL